VITGTVTPAREAILRLRIHGAGGQVQATEAAVETGFNGCLSLPPDLIALLGLQWTHREYATPADGRTILTNMYKCAVEWDGQEFTIPVDEADTGPVVGMSLMYGYKLTLPIRSGAKFNLRRLGKAKLDAHQLL